MTPARKIWHHSRGDSGVATFLFGLHALCPCCEWQNLVQFHFGTSLAKTLRTSYGSWSSFARTMFRKRAKYARHAGASAGTRAWSQQRVAQLLQQGHPETRFYVVPHGRRSSGRPPERTASARPHVFHALGFTQRCRSVYKSKVVRRRFVPLIINVISIFGHHYHGS